MNILFLFDRPFDESKGGVERVTHIISEGLRKKGHNIFFLSIDISKEELEGLPSDKYHYYIKSQDQDLFYNIIQTNKIDIVINHILTNNAYRLLNNFSIKGTKIISLLHFQPFAIINKERKYFRLLRPTTKSEFIQKYFSLFLPFLYRQVKIKLIRRQFSRFINTSDKFILLSDKFIPRLRKYIPNIDIKKIDYINNPNTFDKKIVTSEKENIILFVGRMIDPQKNVKGFIDVWKKFNKKFPLWKGIILGDGPHKLIFEKYAKKNKVSNLYFMGNVKDVASFYAKSKCLCMTSVYEGWGMVLTEALSYGCIPVVYETYEAVHDIIENEETGYIIPPFKTKKMVKVLSQIASNDSLRISMANKGKQSVERFSTDKIVDIWDEKLKNILNI